MTYLFYVILGYLSGGITFGYLIPKLLKGIDIRRLSEDGNAGTANAFIYGGILCGILVLMGDLLKGALPVYLALREMEPVGWKFALVMAAPVAGHAYPLFEKIKEGAESRGGKAIAVSFGVLLGLYPYLYPALTLAVLYILFSVVIVVDPHSLRTAVTFLFWTIWELLSVKLYALRMAAVFIATIVIRKHMPEIKNLEKSKVTFAFRKG